MKKIGIIGGSGAFATSFLLQKINEKSVSFLNANKDSDFLDIVVFSSPYIYLNHKGEIDETTFNTLLNYLHQLENLNCQIILIACNTLYQFFNQLNNQKLNLNTQIVNLPQLVCSNIDNNPTLILCSEESNKLKIYNQYIENSLIYPNANEQQIINKIINDTIIYKNIVANNKEINKIINVYIKNYNVNNVILGCTELSVLNIVNKSVNIYDSINIVSEYLNIINKG